MSSYRGGIYLQNNRKVTFFVLRERHPAAREAFGSEATSEAVEALLAAPHSACSIFEDLLCTSSSLLAFLGHFLLSSVPHSRNCVEQDSYVSFFG
jgi:hypothetical protein